MSLAKWYKPELQRYSKEGYKAVVCKDEQEALDIKKVLRDNKRCAQAGYIANNKGENVYFVITKDKKVKED